MIISLPTWILRLYMDISIYDYIQNYENDEIGDYLRKQLMFLHKSANVEIILIYVQNQIKLID